VNSNQAVLFGCVKRLKSALGPLPPMPALGRLMQRWMRDPAGRRPHASSFRTMRFGNGVPSALLLDCGGAAYPSRSLP